MNCSTSIRNIWSWCFLRLLCSGKKRVLWEWKKIIGKIFLLVSAIPQAWFHMKTSKELFHLLMASVLWLMIIPTQCRMCISLENNPSAHLEFYAVLDQTARCLGSDNALKHLNLMKIHLTGRKSCLVWISMAMIMRLEEVALWLAISEFSGLYIIFVKMHVHNIFFLLY